MLGSGSVYSAVFALASEGAQMKFIAGGVAGLVVGAIVSVLAGSNGVEGAVFCGVIGSFCGWAAT